MNRYRQSATWMGAVLGSLCAVLILALAAHASDHSGQFTEEFHQTYAITPDGRVELDNINGGVHVATWDQNEIKVDAVKYADSKEKLSDIEIEANSGKDYVSLRTKFKDQDHWHSRNNPGGVEYTLTVPRTIRLDEIKLINGGFDVSGVAGEVRASCINGRVEARDLAGYVKIETINGKLNAQFAKLSGKDVELHSVNGSVDLTIPSDSNAEIEASTVSGGISNDFGIHVNNHHFVGHDMRGELGNGGTHIRIENVNGRVEVHHAQDGHAMSPVKDKGNRDHNSDDDSEI